MDGRLPPAARPGPGQHRRHVGGRHAKGPSLCGPPVRVVITGASRGIGRATALRLAAPGQEFVLHYFQHGEEADAVRRKVVERGGSATLLKADLSDRAESRRLGQDIADRWETIDALVLNAGAYPRAPFEQISDAAFEACFRLNVFGPALLVRDLLPLLRRSASGRVVFVSSVLAFTGSTHGAHYASAKAALLGLTRSLARELAPRITVNAVAPGSIDTAILADDSAERRAERNRSIPLGRLGSAEEVADSVAFLLGPGASYLTGTTLHVNGGQFFA